MLDSPAGGAAVSTFVLFETMSLPKAIAMVVMLAVLGAYVYFVELPQAERDAEKQTILTFEKDAVDTFTLIYPDRTIRLKQAAPAGWDIVEPIQAKADKTTVDNMLNTLAGEEVTRRLDPDASADLALYGLEEPLVKIQLALNDGTKLPQLSIGKDTPVGYSAYVQKEGDSQLHLTRQAVRLGMIKEVKELRDKTVLPFVSTDVKKITHQRDRTDNVIDPGVHQHLRQHPLWCAHPVRFFKDIGGRKQGERIAHHGPSAGGEVDRSREVQLPLQVR